MKDIEELKPQFELLYQELPQVEIYKRLGLCLNTVIKIRQDLGIPMQMGRPKVKIHFKEDMIELAKQEETREERINQAIKEIQEGLDRIPNDEGKIVINKIVRRRKKEKERLKQLELQKEKTNE